MSSAAKLRTAGRATAVLASAALVMTSFGPTAFAWDAPTNDSAVEAGVGSIGLIDTAQSKDNTQGATVVAPGATGQAIGDVRFVIPSTFKKGDFIDFALTDGTEDLASGQPDTRIAFSSMPAVDIDGTAYAADTHVADRSTSTGMAAGSTEGGTLTKWTAPSGSISKAVAPAFTPTLETASVTGGAADGTAAYHNVLRITFNNDSDAKDAKFIGTIKGAKVDVGKSVTTGDMPLTARAFTGGATPSAAPIFMSVGTATGTPANFAGAVANITYPALIADVSMAVASGSVVADGTYQYVGPITVTKSNGTFNGTDPVGFDVTGGTLDPNSKITVIEYDAQGKPTEKTATLDSTGTKVSYTPSNTAVKVVFSNAALKASGTSGQITYTLTGQGSTPAGFLGTGAAPTHQFDIEKPQSQVASNTTATPLPDRIGGQDRYQTAVKIAERALGTNTAGPRGESDNVVIASGEGFADALSSGYLAATKNAQLILTRQGQLPQTDVEFLKTYGAKNVFIVGGHGSVSKAVEDQLKGMQSYDVQAAEKTQQVQTQVTSGTYVMPTTTGDDWATTNSTGTAVPITFTDVATDSLPSGGVVLSLVDSNAASGTIVPQFTTNLPGATTSIVTAPTTSATGIGTVTFDGTTYNVVLPTITDNTGTATPKNSTAVAATNTTQRTITTTETVPGSATDQTAQGSDRKVVPLDTKLTVTRIAGDDRFQTNRKVNEYAGATSVNPVGVTVPEYGKPAKKTAMITNGMAPWDALAAGPLVGNAAGRNPIPVILTAGSTLNVNAKTQIQTLDIEAAMFIGGSGVLPDSLMGEADTLGAYTTRLAGADRWGTAKAIADFAVASPIASTTNKMPGFGFAQHQPILANGGAINGDTGSAVARNAWADALASGPFAAGVGGESGTGIRRVIALTDSTSLPGTTKEMLQKNAASFTIPVLAVGLGGAISTETVAQANQAIANK